MLPISDRHNANAERVAAELRASGLRVEVDDRAESVGRKIRDGELRKAPYMLILGDKEAEDGNVAVRRHGEGDLGALAVAEFAERAVAEVSSRR
ncbi:MAG TPA: His/Gly/Thr/Pro-type tRNA ligase C-terminal domain-containing protein [Thermoleophilaceae bacterium]|nr:His/Gly/Thr/Pro-type tRNA ligase C-terminal domain-containing protein [Thermoleophilaceae bacterium]